MNDTLPPKALIVPPHNPLDFSQGIILFVSRCLDWRPYLPTYEPQRFYFDTNECSQLSGINNIETQANFLKSSMSAEAIKFFTDNGYFDANGSFAFSERYTGIKSGTSINGNSQKAFWDAVRKFGLYPRSKFAYTLAQSEAFSTQEAMCADYYDANKITPDMDALAIQVLEYFAIVYEYTWYNLTQTCPRDLMRTEVQHAPLQIGTPACPSWNSGNVTNCGETDVAHATFAYAINPDGSIADRDQYNPDDKTLSADYFVPIVIKGVVTVAVPAVNGNAMVSLSTIIEFFRFLIAAGLWTVKGIRGTLNAGELALA